VQLLQKLGSSDISEPLNVALNFRDVMVALPQPDGDDLILKAKILDDFLHGDDASLDSAQQRALYVDFLKRHRHIDRKKQRDEFQLALRSDPYFNALRLRFGYAVTCHKAQGGEWSHVIVSCATRQNPRSSDYFRWLYTAMTRTSGKLYLIDPPEIRLQQAGIGWSTPASAEAGSSSGEPKLPDSGGSPPEPIGSQSPALSPQAMFRGWLQAEIRNRLDGTGVEIEDIAHHQYREAYFFKRGAEAARVDIGYIHVIVARGIDGTCPISLYGGQAKIGDAVAVRLAQHYSKKGVRTRIVEIRSTDVSPSADVCRHFRDTTNVTENGLGFTRGDIFIPPHMITAAGIQAGDLVEGIAIVSFDKKRGKWGMKAIEAKRVSGSRFDFGNVADENYDDIADPA